MKKEFSGEKVTIQISVMWIFVFAIIITVIIAFFKNNIFAANGTSNNKENIEKYVAYEKNQNAINILEVIVENNQSNQKLINESRVINFETITEESEKLPKGEKKTIQKGANGTEQVTAMQEYQDGKLITEEIIEKKVTNEVVNEIIHIGTSEFLSKYKVHIGDEMYLIESGEIKKEANDDSDMVYELRRYLNVKLEDITGEWAKIKYKTYEGYIEISKLTSESVTPKIAEKNRIAKLQDELSIDMELNKVSGLTLNDYKTIFAFNKSDKNGIFAENAEIFYNMEQKYNINGIFLASIGIHESAWGTSKLAKEKYNLFGYQAYDRDPINSAKLFENYEDCIETVAKALANNYLDETGAFFNGLTVKDVNKKYASDKEWHTKVYSYMEYLYDKLG